MKLAVQLEKPARAKAERRAPCENNSAMMNQGMEHGPISKNDTKEKMATMLKYNILTSYELVLEQRTRGRLHTGTYWVGTT